MKFRASNIYLAISIIASIIFSTLIWEKISLPFNNLEIIGEYSRNEFNPVNDILRYLIFIFFPILIFFSQIFFNKDKFKYFILNLNNNSSIKLQKNYSILFLFALFLLLLILEFLSVQFQLHNLDLFHEGQQLSSAFKNSQDGSLWSGSYITTGLFYETLSSNIIWNLFEAETIGLKRIMDIFLIFLLKMLLIVLSLKITNFLKLQIFYKNIFFVLITMIFLSIIDYNIASVDHLVSREIPIILSLIFIAIFFQSKKVSRIILFIFGFLSIASLIWGIDRGLVVNLIIISFLLFFLIRKNYRELIFLSSSILLWWFVFYLILGDEFTYFISNTISIYSYISYINGIIHPTPFGDHPDSYRATKTLLSIILISILTINLFFIDNEKYHSGFKFFLVFLCFVCIFSYVYVVGRSDGSHIKHIFGYPIIFLSIFSLYFLLFFLDKKVKIFNLKFKNYFLVFISIMFFYSFYEIDYKRIKNYPSRFIEYINLNDTNFINNQEINFINKVETLLENKNCVQLFSYDTALHYLLKKKSCTKYYLTWSVGSIPDQNNFIDELGDTKFIISKGAKFNWLAPLEERLYLVNNYILKNFEVIDTIENWDILKRKID